MKRLEISENGINIVLEIGGGSVGLLRLSALPYDERAFGGRKGFGCEAFPLVLLYKDTEGGQPPLRFEGYSDTFDQTGRLITVRQSGGAVMTETVFRFYGGLRAVTVSVKAYLDGEPVEAAPCLTLPFTPELYAVRTAADGSTSVIPAHLGDKDIRMGMMRCRETGELILWDAPGTGCAVGSAGNSLTRISARGGAVTFIAASGGEGVGQLFDTLIGLRRPTRLSLDERDMPVFFDGEVSSEVIAAARGVGCRYFITDGDGGSLGPIRSGKMLPVTREEISSRLGLIFPAAPSAALTVPPERMLVRCEISEDDTRERIAAVLISGMLSRICISGRLGLLDVDRIFAVKQALKVYKSIRAEIRGGYPFSAAGGGDVYHGIRSSDGRRAYIAVSRPDDKVAADIAVPFFAGKPTSARVLYPSFYAGSVVCGGNGELTVSFGERDEAVLIVLEEG